MVSDFWFCLPVLVVLLHGRGIVDIGVGWGGAWDGLEHMVDATQNLRLGSGGVGWGGVG